MTELLISIPSLIKVGIIFIAIIILSKYKVHLGISCAGGAIILIFWQGKPFTFMLKSLLSLIGPSTILLMCVVLFILVLSSIMKEKGLMDDIVTHYRGFFPSPRITLATLPMIIGMLPMPGGAIFSAPLVDRFDPEHTLKETQKGGVNYFFRHVMETWWPLYPAVIFAIDFSHMEIHHFVFIHFFIFIPLFLAGIFFLLRKTDFSHLQNFKSDRAGFFQAITPILIVLGSYIVIALLLRIPGVSMDKLIGESHWDSVKKYSPILAGLIASIIYLGIKKGNLNFLQKIREKRSINLVLILLGVKYFAYVIKESGIALDIANELTSYHIPILSIICILPFIAGMLTGVGFACVGISFPIIMPIIPADLSHIAYGGYIMLAYMSGYIGMLLSPVHLCIIVTADYFKITFLEILKKILPITIVLFAYCIIYFLILTKLLG